MLAVVAVCALSDLLLIGLGVAGLGTLVQREPVLLGIARWGGALFLAGYGALAARRALATHTSRRGRRALSRRAAILACLGFTYLNPHCWLDTVVLIGALSAQQPDGRATSSAPGPAPPASPGSSRSATARACSRRCSRAAPGGCSTAGIAAVMWSLALALVLRPPA